MGRASWVEGIQRLVDMEAPGRGRVGRRSTEVVGVNVAVGVMGAWDVGSV